MIKKIYCFGTSFTEGGGFEFHFNKSSRYIYSGIGELLTQSNFSYPGQLQNLLKDTDIEVINLAKSGYGNERIYRLATDLVLSDDFNKDETLFLIEFSHLGRKELYSKNLEDYIIVNYATSLNNKDKILSEFLGAARKYQQEPEISNYEQSQLPSEDWFRSFVELTIEPENQHELTVNNSTVFLSFLKQNGVNYLMPEPAFYLNPNFWDNLINPNLISDLKNNSIHDECNDKINGTISLETYGYHSDNHYGLISNKLIASKIYDELIQRNYIKGNKLQKNRKDFDYIQEILLKNYNKLKTND